MPIFFKQKICFIHIPKTAGTSIFNLLREGEPLNSYLFNVTNGERCKKYRKTPQHFTYIELQEQIQNLHEYKCFTVVRNPYSRLVSEYLWGMKKMSHVYMRFKSFDDFIFNSFKMSREERIPLFDGHIEPQTDYIKHCNNINIFYYERLNELISWLEQLEVTNKQLPYLNMSDKKINFNDITTNKDTIKYIQDFYYDDFIKFNYDLNFS